MKLALTAGLSATALILTTGPALAAADDWHETPTGVDALLPYSISTGGGALWTVGAIDTRDDFQPVAARWVNGKWQTTPQPAGHGRLGDVAVRTADDAWAVGAQWAPGALWSDLLVQHWNGKAWKQVAGPTPAREDGSEFYTVAIQGGQVWAAGSGPGPTEGSSEGIVYRYDGKRWIGVNDAISAASLFIYDIAPLSRTNVWIAAENGIKHYDGQHWKDAALPGGPSPAVHLRGLAAVSPSDIWAVGHREDPVLRRRPLVYHFNGKVWSEVSTPADSGELWSVNLVKGQPVAVGESPRGPYLLRMTGTGFVRQPDPAGAGLLFSSTVTGGRLWIAGKAADNTAAYVGFSRLGSG
ncbi:beta propeller repeat protein [Kribbella monticola]|uniref:hypothetical protein n=1 Tax=Kribbella monticola TaxID=2185285 RepID=UPI000DD4DD41|nr:hypothetical protein [Kribbella monticola]